MASLIIFKKGEPLENTKLFMFVNISVLLYAKKGFFTLLLKIFKIFFVYAAFQLRQDEFSEFFSPASHKTVRKPTQPSILSLTLLNIKGKAIQI